MASAGAANAHAYAEPYVLPVPLGVYLVGAALLVLVAAWLGTRRGTWPRRYEPAARLVVPRRLAGFTTGAVRVASVALAGAVVLIGMTVPAEASIARLVPVALWSVWWVGTALASVALGDVWAWGSPLATVGRWVRTVRWRVAGHRPPPLRLPDAWQAWPAAIGTLTFAWGLTVWPANGAPDRVAAAVAAYALVTWLAMALFGVEPWLRRGETFAVLFAGFARWAPLSWSRDDAGATVVRWRASGQPVVPVGADTRERTASFIVAWSAVTFGAFGETEAWGRVLGGSVVWLYDVGFVSRHGFVAAHTATATLGLVATIAFAWTVAGFVAAPFGHGVRACVARRLTPSLGLVTVGVLVAHEAPLLALSARALAAGTLDAVTGGIAAGGAVPPEVIDTNMARAWAMVIVAIVGTHAVAVWNATRAPPSVARGPCTSLPFVATIACLAALGLWTVAQPMVTGP